MKLQKSKSGFIVAGIFVSLALTALFWHLHSVKTNPGDSGESGIILLPFSLPWLLMLPESFTYSRFYEHFTYAFYLAAVALNTFILYAIGGGVKWKS